MAERVSDIRWALSAPDIKAIICNRGGYGTIQLIDQLTLAELKASPKWLVGFSDITAPATPAAVRMRLAGKIQ